MTKALLVIDLQNDYFPGGKFPLWNTEAVLQNIERAIEKANAQGIPVVIIQHIANSKLGIAPFFNEGTPGRTGTGIARGFGTGHASSQTAEYFNDSFASPWVFPSPFSSFAGFLRRVDLLQKPRKLQTVSFSVSFRLA